ncbi:NAD(P)-dependent dehydrogenase (short-subunit alcohol dehydrogenase family) [Actinocorallia herbida]|uniref:NAD(P)-dependent dehydrogenase (Short-subunit alcohol dehydrogenase family) n=1 Tax=Actinocorallia herbida TaxID=58109 RepID=A0A3N1CSR6_9ACTN|nr:SDR family oxidoreductase [Actinocorallia herbida]ROO84255.1 NAD(P)-dependent dehydrogenase (short-subunit alcohol dehydrogenase family) [Actinocorallia herbida]
MELGLAGRTAVVTGAGRGIGLETVRALVAEGVRVVGGTRTVTKQLTDTGAEVVAADLGTAEGVALLVDRAIEVMGGVDLLVNNVGAGDDVVPGGFLDADDDAWGRVFDLNLMSAVRATRAALPSLLERGGRVVNVSSINARMPSGGPAAYSAAKAALTAFGKSLAEEFGPRGVRVNTVSPGVVRTAIWEDPEGFGGKLAAAVGADPAKFLARLPRAAGITTGRLTEPHEVAALIVYLLSDAAAPIMGADYVIDGGTLKSS